MDERHPIIPVLIGENEYSLHCIFSVNDYMRLLELQESGDTNSRRFVAETVLKHLTLENFALPDIALVLNSDHVLGEYITVLIHQESKLADAYNEIEGEGDCYTRFVIAERNANAKALAEALSQTQLFNQEWLKQYQVNTKALTAFATQTVTELSQLIVPLDNISKNVNQIAQAWKNSVQSIIQPTLDNLGKISEAIRIPDISDERRRGLQTSFEQWGNYQWIVPPFAPFGLFNQPPKDKETADKIALRYCTKKNMQAIFEELQQKPDCAVDDIKEAIYDFGRSKYKSCSLMLFSLIDGELVRIQPLQTDDNQWRRVGTRAITRFQNQIDKSKESNNGILTLFGLVGLFKVLNSLYQEVHNFSPEPDILNRNFVVHGMNSRPVSKTDCIKLFILYHWLLKIIGLLLD